MSKSPYLNLTLTPESENTKKFAVWRVEMAGDAATSNMMLIDAKMQELAESIGNIKLTAFTWGDLKNGSSSLQNANGVEF